MRTEAHEKNGEPMYYFSKQKMTPEGFALTIDN